MNKLKITFFGSFLLVQVLLIAQPVVRPLGSNGEQAKNKKHVNLQKSDRALMLEIPFIDDFSNRWQSPVDSLWLDHSVYVNADYPVNPPSVGVATFDGLDRIGNPYSTTNTHGSADTLTSRQINLQYLPSDSLYLSFYYQPKGLGNFPEFIDTFAVEFYNPADSLWHHAWSTKGEDYPQLYRPFRAVMIPIKDTSYLKPGFQFRFRNYAQLNGSWDHWHLDYVRLDKNRNRNDTTFNDVAFMYRASSILLNYQNVPLSHFLPAANDHMAETYSLSLTNNSPGNTNKLYAYNYYNANSMIVDFLNAEAQGPIPFRAEFEFTDPVKYTYGNPGTPWTIYKLVHFLTENSDNISKNDTTVYEQILSNYYALDDGTAEERLSINNNGGGFVGQRFETYIGDTLKSVQFYFNRADDGAVSQPFNIMVWGGGANVPGGIIVSDSVVYPEFESLNKFHTYVLSEPVYLPAGTYYFGWAQTAGFNLNVGYDRNFNHNDRIFYNLSGNWFNYSAQPGTLMIRPLFGSETDPYVGIPDKPEILQDWNLYPNPASEYIELNRGVAENSIVTVMDVTGRIIISQLWNGMSARLNTAGLVNGVYLVSVTDPQSGQRSVKRLAIRH